MSKISLDEAMTVRTALVKKLRYRRHIGASGIYRFSGGYGIEISLTKRRNIRPLRRIARRLQTVVPVRFVYFGGGVEL